jgi:hypothetical protein
MARDWIPGVDTMASGHNGGTLLPGPRRMTWHTFEASYDLTAEAGARALVKAGNEVHFVLHPHGGLVQILGANVAGRGLENHPGGVETNRLGLVHLQVEVIGRAASPFTADLSDAGRRDLATLMKFARDHEIPDVWPAGSPPEYPHGSSPRSVATWTREGGHYGHSQVPENNHGDPGAIDVDVLFGASTPLPPVDNPQEDDVQFYAAPDPAGQPGDGYLAITPGGVHVITGIEWEVLKGDPAAKLVHLPRVKWESLRAIADPSAVDIPALASAVLAGLPAETSGLTADTVAAATADVIMERLRS